MIWTPSTSSMCRRFMTTTADAEPTTALIYALGGGRGHAQRAVVLAERFSRSLVLHQCDEPPVRLPAGCQLQQIGPQWSIKPLRDLLLSASGWAETLLIDTFPGGVAGEVDHDVLSRYANTVLLRRYVRPGSYPDYEMRAAAFAEQWLPYAATNCEWDGAVPGRYIGSATRRLELAEGQPCELVVVGNPSQLPPAWTEALPADTKWLDGPFAALPRARRYLSIGAGHNISYELRRLGADAAFVPLERRYDDQFRRADRHGAGIYSGAELRAFLEA